MGTVFRAVDLQLNRVVAIKQMDRWQDFAENSVSFSALSARRKITLKNQAQKYRVRIQHGSV